MERIHQVLNPSAHVSSLYRFAVRSGSAGQEGSVAVRSAGAIVIGGYINGLGVIRALAARKVRTAVITTKPYDVAQHSRCVSGHDAILDLDEEPDRLVTVLERRAPEWAGSALFPTNDGALASLAHHRERLSATYRVIAPPQDVARYFLDKEQMLDVARAVGVDLPHCYGRAVEATVACPDLRFPVVVKPTVGYRFFSRFGFKLFVAHDRRELRRCVQLLADAGLAGQVFDLIPGPDSLIYAYCTYIDGTGEPRGGLTVRKLRQSPPLFGVARVAEIVADNPTLREATIAILRRVGFRGMAAAEFKLDPRDGRLRFLEVNGRSVIYHGLLRKGGLDLTALAWSDYVDGHPTSAEPAGWPGAWINLHADLLYSLLYRRLAPVPFSELLATYRRPCIEAIWSPRDPLPFLTQWTRTLRAGVSAMWRGRHREMLVERHAPGGRPLVTGPYLSQPEPQAEP
jgi:predicted ATP-grasp superfamily ATP-dependent carboligase